MRKHLPLILVIALLAGILSGAHMLRQADAQVSTPQILLNWKADSYIPDGFPGKALPAADSRITVGADLIDLGRRVDLSKYKVFWYIDDKFYQGSVGLSQISFAAPHFIGATSLRVKVLVMDYGTGPGKTITIPVVVPEAVIQSSAPSLAASAAPFSLQAYPYFFNIEGPAQLNFNWKLNGVSVGNQNPFIATAEMAQKGPSRVELSVSNPSRLIERITRELTIFK
jgi:hypothetical protein